MTEYTIQTKKLPERLRSGDGSLTVNELKDALSGPPISLSIHVPEEGAVRHVLATTNLGYIPSEFNAYTPSTDTTVADAFDMHLKEWLLVSPSKVLSIYLKPADQLGQLG